MPRPRDPDNSTLDAPNSAPVASCISWSAGV